MIFILFLCFYVSVIAEAQDGDCKYIQFNILMHQAIVILKLTLDCLLPKLSLPDYYWRVYQGIVPKDAVVGGITANGVETYIGQLLLKGVGKEGIIPGTLYNTINKIEVAAKGVYSDQSYATVSANYF